MDHTGVLGKQEDDGWTCDVVGRAGTVRVDSEVGSDGEGAAVSGIWGCSLWAFGSIGYIKTILGA